MVPLKRPLWSRKFAPYRVVFYDFYVNTFATARVYRCFITHRAVGINGNAILRISAWRDK